MFASVASGEGCLSTIDFAYTVAPSRLPDIFKEIRSAGTPAKFTNEFLKTTLGFSSSNDRAIIKILRQLGFIDASGVPTARYNAYKGPQGGRALAQGLREGWSALFLSNTEIHEKPLNEVNRRVASITGANEEIAKRMAGSFKSLCSIADWTSTADGNIPDNDNDDEAENDNGDQSPPPPAREQGRFELHHDIHLHLPAAADPAVYRAIFQALKAELL